MSFDRDLPLFGHLLFKGNTNTTLTQRKSVALEYALYALTLLTFCFYILPSIGLLVTEKCISSHYCAYDYRRTALGYSVDRADGQWTMMRGQLWVLGSFAAVLIALHRAYVGGSPTGTRLLAPLWERFGERAAASADFHAASGFLFLVVQVPCPPVPPRLPYTACTVPLHTSGFAPA